VLTLYDAARCPYAARVRITLAEKGISYDAVAIDLDDRPAWLYDKNPAGRVPVLEEDGGLVLPESAVIIQYLDERFPEPALLPADPAERALARLRIERFDDLGSPYYALRRGENPDRFESALAALDALLEAEPFLNGREYGLADIAYVPWLLRARTLVAFDLTRYESVESWLERLAERPAVQAEIDVVESL
jgi:glutathione S-transferase